MTRPLALAASMAALERASTKHPLWPTDPIHAAAILAEEVGELQREVLQLTYEPAKGNPDRVREEALDLAAVALRFLISLDSYQFKPSQLHHQP
jgi:NTP pyrophosphatase (non-canonical NTP hydrolase)